MLNSPGLFAPDRHAEPSDAAPSHVLLALAVGAAAIPAPRPPRSPTLDRIKATGTITLRLSRQRGAVLVQGPRRPHQGLQRRALHARGRRDPEGARDDRAQDRMGAGRGRRTASTPSPAARSTPTAGRRRSRSGADAEGRFQPADLRRRRQRARARAKSKLAQLADLKGKRDRRDRRHDDRAGARPRRSNSLGARGGARAGQELRPRAWRCSTKAQVDGYAGDRIVLANLKLRAPKPGRLRVRRRRFFVRALRPRRARATIPISSSR